jgi:P pilus assembly chaperone PapD
MFILLPSICIPTMKALIKGAIVLLLAAALVGINHLSSAAEGGISVWPTWVELTVNGGEQAGKTINVVNQGSEPIRVMTYTSDFSIDREGNFLFSEPGHESYSASKWLSLEETELEIAPGESREVEVSISVPAEVEPGGHYAALFFEAVPSSNEGAISISTRIPSLFYLTVPGVTEADISANADIVSLMMPGIAEKGPVEMGVMVRNSGNVHLTVAAKAHIASSWGNASELGLGQVVVLPNTEALMKGTLQEMPLFGRVKASVVIGYLDQNGELVNKSQTAEFWIVPWSLIGIIVGVMGVMVPAIIVLRKRYRLRVERR